MMYSRDGINAHIREERDCLVVSGFEIDDGLLQSFGEEGYLSALRKFVEHLSSRGKETIHVPVTRNGYRMLLSRFGFVYQDGVMVKGATSPASNMDASTMEAVAGSLFTADAALRMSDGNFKSVCDIDVGDEVYSGGLITSIFKGRQRRFVQIGEIICSTESVLFFGGEWIKAKDHPDAVEMCFPDGVEGYSISTVERHFYVSDMLFAGFYETRRFEEELHEFSDVALEAMNGSGEPEENTGWSTDLWTRSDIDIVRPWWGKMEAAGYGDWGYGPLDDEIAPIGMLTRKDGVPIACVFIYCFPPTKYAAIYAAICDVEQSPFHCIKALSLAAKSAIDHCRDIGFEKVVSYVKTPAVVSSFEAAGLSSDSCEYNHVYLSEEARGWLSE